MESTDREARFAGLDLRFDRAIDACLSGTDRVTVLFSGGVDSCLVASGVRGRTPIELLTVGTLGSRDPRQAYRAARELDLPLRTETISERDIAEVISELGSRLAPIPEPARGVQVALAIALRRSTSPLVLAGQGSDELFGGYAHFRGISGPLLQERRHSDWDRLVDVDWPFSEGTAHRYNKQLRSPFLDPSFASFALGIPLTAVGPERPTKPLLRAWARHRGLSEQIADRPKVAMQYGSGVSRFLKRLDGRPSTAVPAVPD
jgi:asparagine synthase (glutamine-hydrolysing)